MTLLKVEFRSYKWAKGQYTFKAEVGIGYRIISAVMYVYRDQHVFPRFEFTTYNFKKWRNL